MEGREWRDCTGMTVTYRYIDKNKKCGIPMNEYKQDLCTICLRDGKENALRVWPRDAEGLDFEIFCDECGADFS